MWGEKMVFGMDGDTKKLFAVTCGMVHRNWSDGQFFLQKKSSKVQNTIIILVNLNFLSNLLSLKQS